MANFSTGVLQGVALYTGGVVPLCSAISGGAFTWNVNNIVVKGIGGQRVVRKGTSSLEISLSCIGTRADFLQAFFPTSAGAAVAGVPDLLVDQGGSSFILYGVQPASASISVAEGLDSVCTEELSLIAAGYTAASGTISYQGLPSTINQICVEIGETPVDVMSFTISSDLSSEIVNLMNCKASGSQTFPSAIIPTDQEISFSMTTTEPFGANLADDCHTELDLSIEMTTCGTGSTRTISISNLVPGQLNVPFEADGGIVGYAHEYTIGDGTTYNRVTIADA